MSSSDPDFPSYADRANQPADPQHPGPPGRHPSPAGGQPLANGNGNRVAATAARTQSWAQQKLHQLSLHARVTLLAAVAVGLAVAFVSVAAYLTVRQQMYRNLDDSLIERATHAAKGPRPDRPGDHAGFPPEAFGLSRHPDRPAGLERPDRAAPQAYLPPIGPDRAGSRADPTSATEPRHRARRARRTTALPGRRRPALR